MKEKKLAFRDKLKFIIPKLKTRSDYTGKTCLKHHSTLCKVCPLLKKAKAYKIQVMKQQLRHVHEDNPFSTENDLKSCADDPFCHADDLLDTASNNIVTEINSINNSIHTTENTKEHQIGSQLPLDSEILTKFDFGQCPHCGNCYCPRGTRRKRKRNHYRKKISSPNNIPSLLDLPFVVPPKYR